MKGSVLHFGQNSIQKLARTAMSVKLVFKRKERNFNFEIHGTEFEDAILSLKQVLV